MSVAVKDLEAVWMIGAPILLIAALIALWIVSFIRRRRFEREMIATAEFIEESYLNFWGGVSAIALFLWNVIGIAMLTGNLKTVFQEVAALLLWIGGNQILIMGVMVGRRRRFVMRQKRRSTQDGERREPAL